MMADKIKLPEVEKVYSTIAGPDAAAARKMFGTTFYPIVYFSPETGQCVVSYPKGIPDSWRYRIIDMGIAALVAARDEDR